MKRIFISIIAVPVGIFFLPWVILLALVARFRTKPIDIGLGPQPLINNIHHKQALILGGFSAETFCVEPYFITSEFDRVFLNASSNWTFIGKKYLAYIRAYSWSILRHRCHYLYFNGGALGSLPLLQSLEPCLYALARVRTVMMPYGADVHTMARTKNLIFKRSLREDYPTFHESDKTTACRVRKWERQADYIICGADWVDYVDHWDKLMLGHFSIDAELWDSQAPEVPKDGFTHNRPLRILHAPNHREIKGTRHFRQAVEQLRKEGCPVELVTIEKKPNDVVREAILQADVIADQLIIGWYAMFAIEGMAMRRPVLCYLRPDLVDFYVESGLWEKAEIPLVNTSHDSVIEKIRMFLEEPKKVAEIGNLSRQFVEKHHSTEAIGSVFREINESLGIYPTGASWQKKK